MWLKGVGCAVLDFLEGGGVSTSLTSYVLTSLVIFRVWPHSFFVDGLGEGGMGSCC